MKKKNRKKAIEEICLIHLMRQFFEASGTQGHFFEKKSFQISSRWACVSYFRSPSVLVRSGGVTQTDDGHTDIQANIGNPQLAARLPLNLVLENSTKDDLFLIFLFLFFFEQPHFTFVFTSFFFSQVKMLLWFVMHL